MTMQKTAPHITTKARAFTKPLAIAGAAAILTVTVSVGAWQIVHSGSTNHAPATVAPFSGGPRLSPAAAGASAAPSGSHVSAVGPVIYLTTSAGAQAAAESDLDAAATIRRAFGDSVQLPQAALITSAAGEAQLRQSIAEENQVRSSLGLPEITIVDLRPTTAAMSTVPDTAQVAAVSSPNDEAQTREMLYELNAIRHTLGLPDVSLDDLRTRGATGGQP